MRTAAGWLIILAACACAPPPSEVARDFARAHNRRDSESVARLFTEHSRIRLADGRLLVGPAGVAEFMAWSRATRRQIRAPHVYGQDRQNVWIIESSDFLWRLGPAWMHYSPGPRLRLEGRRIAELDLTGPREDQWRRREESLAAFEVWARDARPRALERLREGDRWRFESAVAELWMETLEAWRLARDGPFRISVVPVQERFPFGTFPRFEVTVRNVSDRPLSFLSGSDGVGDRTMIQLRIVNGEGADYGYGTSVQLEDGVLTVPPGSSEKLVVPSHERPFYRTSDRAMIPDRYHYHVVLTGVRAGETFGGATSAGGGFEVTDDESEDLQRLRAVIAGSQARARLSLVVEQERPRSAQLYAVNTGWSELSFGGSYWMWHMDGPDGHRNQSDGPRGSDVETLVPGQRRLLQGISLERSTPGWHRVWAVYYTPDLEPICESNKVVFRVP